MSTLLEELLNQGKSLSFSGHETFVLRGNWLKKAYDLLRQDDTLFYQEEAFVRLGVGKNMAQSIRFWGRVCGIFDRAADRNAHQITPLGHALLADDGGWDPFLTTSSARWLLHYKVSAYPEAAFSWYFTFNLLRRGEFTLDHLARHISDLLARYDQKLPSAATLRRDIDCLLRCYVPVRSTPCL